MTLTVISGFVVLIVVNFVAYVLCKLVSNYKNGELLKEFFHKKSLKSDKETNKQKCK